ncbi:MAG: HIT family protein [Chitinophagaceae bacterium]|nr:HIT family protein [Chitinophagaceae bacterium]
MSTIFSKIIKREIPAYIVCEDDNFIAFLDVNPLVLGHCLVVPKKEIDYIFDQEDFVLENILLFAKKIAKAIEKSIPCRRVCLSIIGLEVPHTHLHLVPVNSMADMNFSKTKLIFSKEEMYSITEKIKQHL